MALQGKGIYLWKIPQVMGGDPQAIADKAVEAGLSHVLIKIADGAHWIYNYNKEEGIDLIPPVRDALREAGISVWGWQYIRGNDPSGEARMAVDRMQVLGLDGFVIDAEKEYKEKGKRVAAHRYMQELRQGLPKTPIALSSYRYPKMHQPFPFETFLERCDLNMPQVYFVQAHNPEGQLERTIEQYSELTPNLPIVSTGPAYRQGSWIATADEITRFMRKAKDLGQSAVNFWGFDFVLRMEMSHIWEAIKAFDWPADPPKADIVEQLIGRMNQRDATLIESLYQPNAAHVTGARTVVGRDRVGEWYTILFNQLLPNASFELTGMSGNGNSRHFTWNATSDQGVVRDGNDTIGLRDGIIQYHYTYFTIE
jgi:hypothetical protein